MNCPEWVASLPIEGALNWMIFQVLSNPNHCRILWFFGFEAQRKAAIYAAKVLWYHHTLLWRKALIQSCHVMDFCATELILHYFIFLCLNMVILFFSGIYSCASSPFSGLWSWSIPSESLLFSRVVCRANTIWSIYWITCWSRKLRRSNVVC